MRHQTVGTEEGAFMCDLTDYETVKALADKILWTIRDAWKLPRTCEKGVKTRAQAMPKGMDQMPQKDIDTFAEWIDQGMAS